MRKKNTLTLFLIVVSNLIFSQQDSLKTLKLKEAKISATKIKEEIKKLPVAIFSQDFSKSQDSRQQLSFNDYLNDVPGLFALNANNYSQDLRVSIRGFGARSAFGIRGIKIIVDGIPETTPDGQGQIDNLNLTAIKNIEVIRGPSSLLYGNASGGVISINTENSLNKNYAKAGMTLGSYSMQQYQIGFGLKGNKTSYIFNSNQTKTDGYRDFSAFKSTNLNGRIFHRFNNDTKLNFQINYTDSPYAQDAGSLNADAIQENRRQARQRNVDYDTQESIKQLKLGTNFTHQFDNSIALNAYGFFATREFYGKLPFEFGGIVDLNRNYFGQGSSISFNSDNEKLNNKLQAGYELAFQNDNRKRFRNLEGTQGDNTLNQDEIFNTYGFYVLNHLTVNKFLIRAGLRYDNNTLKIEDAFLTNGNDSDEIKLNAFNYSLGVNYNFAKNQFIYGNISTSFETPVLSELSANPVNEGGFNQNLKPQNATNYEVGYKLKNNKTLVDVALFYIETKDDIVPFELEAFPDRDFFRNAGSTNRKGLEVFIKQALTNSLNTSLGYTYSEFKYDDYITANGNFNNKLLPAIPKHKISLNTSYQNSKGLFIQLQGQHIGSLYTNDSNTVKDDAYTNLNLRVKQTFKINKLSLTPFFGINNLLNEEYNDNVRINAFGSRYFEPAPKFNIYAGLKIKV